MDRGYQLRFDDAEWLAGKEQARSILRATASKQTTMTYTDLSNALTEIQIAPHDPAMAAMLGQISEEEYASGNGMLSVLVVHKHGDLEPGKGFYECAEGLGLEVADQTEFWIKQLKFVHARWA